MLCPFDSRGICSQYSIGIPPLACQVLPYAAAKRDEKLSASVGRVLFACVLNVVYNLEKPPSIVIASLMNSRESFSTDQLRWFNLKTSNQSVPSAGDDRWWHVLVKWITY